MLAGVAMSNSILIVEFAHHQLDEGLGVREAVITACRVRLRPVLITSSSPRSSDSCQWL